MGDSSDLYFVDGSRSAWTPPCRKHLLVACSILLCFKRLAWNNVHLPWRAFAMRD